MPEEDPKPKTDCRFCKNAPKGLEVQETHFHHYVVACLNCDATGPVGNSPADAVSRWDGGME